MPVGALDHYALEPADLEASKDFYCEALGLEDGDRPPFPVPGYWLYSAGVPTVHLIASGPRPGPKVAGTGHLGHIAFAATDLPGVRQRLQSKNVEFRETAALGGGVQIFLHDPDGVGVELNFPAEEASAA